MIGSFHNGFRQLTNNKRPVTSPEDLKGLNIRVPGSEIWHRQSGRGRIVSLQGTLPAIRFEAPGEPAPRTFCLPAALQNGFLSFKTDAPG